MIKVFAFALNSIAGFPRALWLMVRIRLGLLTKRIVFEQNGYRAIVYFHRTSGAYGAEVRKNLFKTGLMKFSDTEDRFWLNDIALRQLVATGPDITMISSIGGLRHDASENGFVYWQETERFFVPTEIMRLILLDLQNELLKAQENPSIAK